MKKSGRQLQRSVTGASAGIAAGSPAGYKSSPPYLTPSMSEDPTDFFVICHGMMVFEVIPPDPTRSYPGNLILHLPNVPPSGLDLCGHIYKAASYAGSGDARDLATASEDSQWPTWHFSLEGAAGPAGLVSVDQLDPTANVCLYKDTTPMGGPENPLIRIAMPLPRYYRGWRYVYNDIGPVIQPGNTPPSGLPDTIYLTHIFAYSSSQQPTLRRDSDDSQVWPNTDTASASRLHIFAQPPDATGDMGNHSGHLHKLFNPPLDIGVTQDYCVHEEPPGNVVAGFTLLDLIGWDESLQAHRRDYCHHSNLLSLEPTNCRSYGYGG